MNWAEYVALHAASRNQTDLARLVDVSQSAISRWISGKTPAPEADNVIGFARSVGDSPVTALIAAGYLKPDDLEKAVTMSAGLGELDASALLVELGKRLGIRVAITQERRRGA